LGINWTAGEVYCAVDKEACSTDAGSGNLVAGQVNYLKWTGTSTLEIEQTTSSGDDILIATFSTYNTNTVNAFRETNLLENTLSDTRRALRLSFPNRIISGLSITEDADVTNPLDIHMDAGQFVKDGIEVKNPSAIDSRTNNLVRHFHTAGEWDSDTNAEIDTTKYDNGDNLVNIPANKYVKSYFILMQDKIGWIYPTAYYNNLADAEASSLSERPLGLSLTPALTAIVYQQGDTDFSNAVWQDIRPGISEESFNIVTDHGALAGLGNDDHPQYSLITNLVDYLGNWSLDKADYSTTADILGWNYYNVTNAPTYINDTFAGNYSTFLTHITWANVVNGTMLSQADWDTNYTANDAAWRLDTDTFVANYSDFLTKIDWSEATNGTLALTTDLLPKVSWTDLWGQVYNETEIETILANGTFINTDTTYSAGTNMSLDGTTFNWDGTWAESEFLKSYTETDSLAYNGTLAYLSDILGWGYYNSTDFSISDYYTKSEVNDVNTSMKNYVDSTFTTETYVDTQNTSMKNYVDSNPWSFITSSTLTPYVEWIDLWSQVYNETEIDAINTSMKNYVDATFYLDSNPDGFIDWSDSTNGTLLTASDILPKVSWTDLWGQVYNETEVNAINTSMKNYVDSNPAGYITSGVQWTDLWNQVYNETEIDNLLTPKVDWTTLWTQVYNETEIVAINTSMKNYVDSKPSGGATFDQDLNTTDDVSFNNLYVQGNNISLGSSEGDNSIWFYENGGLNERIYWYNVGDNFRATEDFYVDGYFATSSHIYSGGALYAESDIYTTGSGDDLWLGTVTQANSLFRAYANGSLVVKDLDVTDGISVTETDPHWTGNQSAYVPWSQLWGQVYNETEINNLLLPKVDWTTLWTQVYNETEVNAINTSMKNYVDDTFLTSYTETDPAWNANIANVAFKNESNTFAESNTEC